MKSSSEAYGLGTSFSPWLLLGQGHDISADCGSDACFDLARSWLRECEREHPRCVKSCGPLPTRVVDVGSKEGACSLYVSMGERVPYTTLSHRWAEPEVMCRTLTDNLEARTKAIVAKDLPRTFQDAITITRRLGIKYLWIDSLCIIQDSDEDWKKESRNMASIFSNSHLTIEATSATDPSKGCFLPSRGRGTVLDQMDIRARDGTVCRVCIRRDSLRNLMHLHNRRDGYNKVLLTEFGTPPEDILSDRGWVYQERLQSTRILHYTSVELYWECQTKTSCECRADEQNYVTTRTPSWETAVEVFTRKGLTRPTDRPFAFAGVAALVGSGVDFHLGIREDHAIQDLAWVCADSSPRKQPWYIAPSFSWYSVTGPVGTQRYKNLVAEATKLEVRHGEAEGDSYIQIRGVLVPVRLSFLPGRPWWLCYHVTKLGPGGEEETELTTPFSPDAFEQISGSGDVAALRSPGLDVSETHFALLLGWQPVRMLRRTPERRRYKDFKSAVMLICRHSSRIPEAFERIGITQGRVWEKPDSALLGKEHARWVEDSLVQGVKLV